MSRHWRPRRRDWTVIHNYAPAHQARRRGFILPVLGAVFAGLAGGIAWQWLAQQPADGGPSAPIEWNAVQALPKRTLNADEIAWEKRGEDTSVPIESTASAGSPPATTVTQRSFGICGQQGGRDCVIDGDTFVLGGEHVRIEGADAPETHPPRCVREAQLGLAATAKLQELLNSGTVSMGPITRDKYGRDVRQVVVNGVDVAQALIAEGLASAYSGGRRQGWC